MIADSADARRMSVLRSRECRHLVTNFHHLQRYVLRYVDRSIQAEAPNWRARSSTVKPAMSSRFSESTRLAILMTRKACPGKTCARLWKHPSPKALRQRERPSDNIERPKDTATNALTGISTGLNVSGAELITNP